MSAPSDDLFAAALARPLVRVNQLGYLVDGPKHATVISDESEPLTFRIVDAPGAVVFEGATRPHGDRAVFGTHRIDFSTLSSVGDGFHIECVGASSRPFTIGDDLYRDLFDDALRFFYVQRSGCAISDDIAPGYGRPAGHVGVAPNQGDTRVGRWRGPEADVLYPGWRFDRSIDVSGGWYDAGDHGKYVVCGGLSAAMLLAAYEQLRECSAVPRSRLEGLLDEAMWEVDWMLRMQVPEGEQHAGMAFHRIHDEYWTDLPMSPHDDPAPRVLHRPSTAATLNLAAAAGHAARLVPRRRSELLRVARLAYEAALSEPDLYAPDDHGAFGGGPYGDDDVSDEFYWAATELYLTTGEPRFADDLAASRHHPDEVFTLDGFDCDSVAGFARLQLALHAHDLDDVERLRASVVSAADRLIALQTGRAWGQPYDPEDGWDWGSNGRILANLIVLATAAHLDAAPRFVEGFLSGFDYLLGRNPIGLSFITGYGFDFSHRQRVRHFARALDPEFPPPPKGAIVGGAASKTYEGFPGDPRFERLPAQLCYVDEPTSETTNDVCIRWNSALVLATAQVLRSSWRTNRPS